MYVDSIKIGNTNARAIRTVVDLEVVPTQVFENSPMLIKVGETLYVKNKVVGNIIGTWHLKDTISYATNVGVNFDFVSNDTTYTALLWQNSELHYASQATSDVVVYNSNGWVNQSYRTIVIKSGENADLLAFLQASAEKLIDGYYYYTEVGGSGGVVIEKYTQDMENFADIVFTADEFNTIFNSDSVVVKLNIVNVQNIFFVKTTQVVDGRNPDTIYLNSYVPAMGKNFVLVLSKPQDSTQVAHIVIKQTLPEPPTAINLNDSFPSTATNGTLTNTQLRTLQSSDQNYIIFNNELFRLNDKQSSEGYLVYSHNGHDTTGCFFQKCITITISTLGWVLETQENQAKLTAGSGITIENNVISSTGGGGTTDTAYVSNSTLYIEEGTTAGGGSGEEKALEVEVLKSDISASSIAIDDSIITLTFGASMVISFGMIEEGKTYNNYVNITNAFAKTDSNWYQNLKNGYYDKLVLKSPTELPEIPYMSSELKYNKFVGRYEFSTFGTQIIAPNDYTFTFFNQFLEVSESTMPDGVTKIYSAILYTQYYRPVKNQQIIE